MSVESPGMDITIPLRSKTGELRPQHNQPGPSKTRDNVLEYDPDDYTLVNIRTETVQYGKYAGHNAALIVLRFIIKFRPGKKWLRSFHINIEFGQVAEVEADGTTAESKEQPRVLALAPEERRGKIYTEEREVMVSLGLDVPLSNSDLGARVGVDQGWKMAREHEMKLSGWRGSSGNATDNIVVWDCVEAKKAAKGVLPSFRAAIVVQHEENTKFQAIFKLDVERGFWNSDSKLFDWISLFGKKEGDDPLVFNPSQPVGTPVAATDFKDLKLDELVELQPIATLPSRYN